MTLQELATVMNSQIVIRSRDDGTWYASIENCEVKGDGVLISAFGNGRNPETALNDYVDQIRGKTLVVNASFDRKEFKVPTTLQS